MSYKYKVSVIMGVYNESERVLDALQSLLAQSISDIEILICDDASTDNTYDIISGFIEGHSNITLLKNDDNRGLGFSLNRCIDLSEGEYLARMDADDTCHPDRLKKQVDFLEKNPEYDLVGTQYIMVKKNGTRLYSHKKTIPKKNVLPLDVPFAHPTVVIRKSSMRKLGKYTVDKHTKYCEDLDLWYRFFSLNLLGYNIQEYLYYKNQKNQSYPNGRLKYSFDLVCVNFQGLKKLTVAWYYYILAFKPFVSSLTPNLLKNIYHSFIFQNSISDRK